MTRINRRTFLDRSKVSTLGIGMGLTILSDPGSLRATPANDRIVMAIVGCGGRGVTLARGFAARDDCEIAYCRWDRTSRAPNL